MNWDSVEADIERQCDWSEFSVEVRKQFDEWFDGSDETVWSIENILVTK